MSVKLLKILIFTLLRFEKFIFIIVKTSGLIKEFIKSMGSFRCFRDGKCEWTKGLQDFTFQFNEAFGKDYSLSKCLDVSDDKTRKQPEVLLEFPGDKPMVIECKKIVYPPNYYKNHRYFHNFFDDFRASYEEKLKPQLHKDVYQICINENALYESSKRNLPKISE